MKSLARTMVVERGTIPAILPASRGTAAESSGHDGLGLMGIPQEELTPRVRAAIGALVDELRGLRKEVEAAEGRAAALERLSDEDPLLPVVNRRAFVRELARAMAAAARYRRPGSVIYVDVNGLKRVNDTHGHAAGDAVLALVAEVLTGNVRKSDVVGRLGGDEFGVVLANADIAVAQAKTAALADAIGRVPVRWGGTEIEVSAAAGCYTFQGIEELSATLAAADRAMYARKAGAAPTGRI
ncbi:MAG: GGDEF domain-containing protein [Alphaproteobacteria bacterium]